MRLRVLGCHGGESPRHRSTSFLVDDVLAIDAGAITSRLSLTAQRRIRHILISHCHLDHVKDLAMLADNVVGDLTHPIDVVGTPGTLRMLHRHIFNDIIWPDFTRIPTPARPVYRLKPLRKATELRVGSYRVRGIPVSHPVESTGFVVRNSNGAALAFSSDTGPTAALWREVSRTPNLRVLLLEVSFPNRMQSLADRVGHLTPRTLASELRKLDRSVPVLLYHLKPPYEATLKREVRQLKHRQLRLLKLDDTFRF